MATYPRYNWIFLDLPKLEAESKAGGNSLAYETRAKLCPLIHALVVTPASIYALFMEEALAPSTFAAIRLDGATVTALAKQQIYSPSVYAEAVVPVTMAYFIYDLACYSEWTGDSVAPRYNEMMCLHHVLSLILFPASLASGTGHWFLLFFISYELSSPFIYFRWFAQRIIGKGTVWTMSSMLFLISFIFQRVFTIPALTISVLATFNYHADDPILQVLAYSSFIPMVLNVTWAYFIVQTAAMEISAKFKKKQS